MVGDPRWAEEQGRARSDISILIVVDALGAAATGSLRDNVYLVDTNSFIGSWSEGQDDLHTVCQDGQVLNWTATTVSPSNDTTIIGFSGDMVSERICVPSRQGIGGEARWQGRVQSHGQAQQYAYSVQLSVDGEPMTFTPFIKVV